MTATSAGARPPYDRRVGRAMRWLRVAAVVAVALFTLERHRRLGSVSPAMLLAAAGLMLAANLVSWLAARFPDHPWSSRATDVELVLDSLYAIADAATSAAVIGYAALPVPALLVPVEGAFRRGLRGGLLTAGMIAAGILSGRLLLPELFLAGPLMLSDVVPVLVAVPIAGLALGASMRVHHRVQAELAAVNAELREAVAWQQDLLAFAAHEVKSPLTAVVGGLDLLANADGLGAAERDRLLSMARLGAARAVTTADALLGRARVAAGALTPTPEDVDLTALCRDVVAGEAAAGAEIVVDGDAPCRAITDPTLLRHVVTNLVTNARKYGAPPVVVEARRRDGAAEIRVSDDGAGVPPEFVPVLFDRYSRVTGTRATGSGLGLTVVREMIEALQGAVRYEPGEPTGAVFVVTVPDLER